VHKSATAVTGGRDYAVLGFMIELDDTIADADSIFAKMGMDPTTLAGVEKSVTFNPSDLFGGAVSATAGYHGYEGGLTTPPCSLVVNWFVADYKLKIK